MPVYQREQHAIEQGKIERTAVNANVLFLALLILKPSSPVNLDTASEHAAVESRPLHAGLQHF